MLLRAQATARASHLRVDPFVPKREAHPPGIARTSGLASDENIKAVSGWAKDDWNQLAGTGLALSSIFAEGLEFPGYPFLSALAQRPEYRAMVEITATQMTRKWIQFRSTDSEDEKKAEKIADLEKELERLQVRDCFREAAGLDGYFGRSHLYIDTGDTENVDELKTSIGNGRNNMSKRKFKDGEKKLRKLKVVEPVWCYPTSYNASDPLSDNWYTPETWFVMGKEIHASRLLKFSMRPVPDLLKPAYSFGGISLSQLAKPYVDNWIRTRQSVADIVHAFSVFVLSSNIAETLQPGGEQLFERADLFNLMRDNRGLMLIDKDSELFQNVSAPLGSLDALQAQTQEHLGAVCRVPLVFLTGITPAGLNASSEGEIRVFYDWIESCQEVLFRPNLTKIVHFAMLNIWGEIDETIIFNFAPLWSLDEVALANKRKLDADADVHLLDAGVLSPLEIRQRIAGDRDSPYTSLDVEDVPELLVEEAEGLEPAGGRPNPLAMKTAEGNEDPDETQQTKETPPDSHSESKQDDS